MKIAALQILSEDLVERGFLIETRGPSRRKVGRTTVIEVGNTSALDGGELFTESSAAHYLETVRQDRLSWLLFDASIVQMLYHMRGDRIIFHRYAYFPAPFDIDLRAGTEAGLMDLIEGASSNAPEHAPRRSSLRFEFDPQAQAPDHAAAHLHINTPDCRLPMRGPLTVKEFVSFLVRYFYANAFSPDICGPALFEQDPTISDGEERSFHLGWRRAADVRQGI